MKKIFFVFFAAILPFLARGAVVRPDVDPTSDPVPVVFSAEATEVTAGDMSTVTISLDNGELVCNGFQFLLKLPEGITLAYDEEEDDYVYSFTSRYTKKKNMQATVSEKGDGVYQFICFSITGETITGNDGPIFTIGLQTDPSLAGGTYDCSLGNVIVSCADGTSLDFEDVPFSVSVSSGTEQKLTMSAEATDVKAGEISNLVVSLNNGSVVCNGYQFMIKLPEGVSLAYDEEEEEFVYSFASRYTKKKNMQVTLQERGTGEYQLICFSITGETITGSEGPIITLGLQTDANMAGGNYNGTLTNVIASGVDGISRDLDDVPFSIAVEGAPVVPVTVTVNNYSRFYGDENPTFEYSVEGGELIGTPSITCEATKTSNVGTYDIVIGSGSVENANVTYVNGTLTVEKAPLTVKAGDYTMKQGDPLPEFTATYEGFKNDETAEVLTKQPVLTTEATSSTAPGEYAVKVSGAEAQNYEISYVDGKLTITEADPITVTVKSYSRLYGDENPEFEYTVEGGELKGSPAITCSATKTSPVGEYAIEITAGTVENFNVTYVSGKLTVEKAPLTVKAGDYTMKQGDPLPEFTATYEGFKNDETAEVLTKQPVLTTEATSSTAPGEYAVKVSGAEAQNYEISYVDGKLTITEADPITVTVKSYSRLYGDENPEFEYTVEGGELKGVPAITCSATKTSPVGEYAIEIAAGTVENFNVTYVNGKLTVEKAPLTVKAGEYTMKQGDPLPEFTATFEGFKNGETAEVLTKQPVLTTEATSSTAPGEYAVKVSGAEAQNYEISYVDGKLIIAEADAVIVKVGNYTRLYGDENPTFEYTVEGGELIGTPAITCSATKESPIGEYAIEVSAGTVENFNVTYVNGTLKVEKAALTVKAGEYTMKQGDPLPEFTASFEGFKNGETSEVLTKQPMLTTEATSSSAPGEYAVKVSGAEAQNYEISYVDGKLTITEADPITVTVKSYSRLYGDENPSFEYTVEGGELKGAPAISCSATKTSPVGEYAIEIAAGTVENFNVTYVNGTLTVEKAPLTIKAGDYTMKQGDPLPEFAASFEGFKNGETAEVLTKQPEMSTEATSDSEPGTYAVKVSGAEAQNYEISYVDGTLTIIEADAIIVKVNSYTRLYGEENPVFEFVVEGGELIGEPVITCEATKESSVGTYDIVISAGTVENFNVTYVNGTLTVEKAPLLVIANDCERVQFEENPVFTLRYEGFVNGDTEEVLTVKPVASTSATIDSEAGEYEIYVSGGEAENYELSYQSGTLTVHPYSGIAGVTFEHPVNVYSIQGVPVRMQTTSLVGLPRGVYIVEGRKVTVK